MNEIRIIFSPHTAEPAYLGELAGAIVKAQLIVAQAMWAAQLHVLRTVLTAQLTLLDTVYRVASRPG